MKLALLATIFAISYALDYRPQFHVMPPKYWTNDPNGPVYYKGYYHLFYQYNPNAPVWGDMHWGHVVSKDLAHWQHLPIALAPDQSYDSGGVYSGSAVILPNGDPLIVYTGQTNIEQQCVAYPKDPNDPLLQEWVKPSYNPIIKSPPAGGNPGDFRDPTTPWLEGNTWFMATGCEVNNSGSALLWSSTDLRNWKFSNVLYTIKGSSLWECPDFFLEPSTSVYIFKYSGDGTDHWAVGNYNTANHTFSTIGPFQLVSIGRYYASKNFNDPIKKRQINWGWVAEEDGAGPSRGWQGLQSFPCKITIDTELNIPLSNPIEEIQLLRGPVSDFPNLQVNANTPTKLQGVNSTQMEILASFPMPAVNSEYQVRVFELPDQTVYTAITFTRQSATQGTVIVDRSHSGTTGNSGSQGGPVAIKASDHVVSLHILVDHSVVEVFGFEGRIRITSRLYTPASATFVSVFSTQTVTASVKVWEISTIWN